MTHMIRLAAVLIASSSFAWAQPLEYGADKFIEYQTGGLPLIIGAPHGGYLKPESLANRTYGVLDQDSNTQELAGMIQATFQQKLGAAPHLIICRLHRSKMDANREIVEATQGGRGAEQAWRDWQGFIIKAKAVVQKQFGTGLYIDLHGQRHKEARVELGYMIGADKLRLDDAALERSSLLIRQSSIRELDQRSPASFVELLRGSSSLGGLLQARGFASVPSPAFPAPKEDEQYFRGGFNTDTHGSRQGGPISAVQIECPWLGVRDTPANRAKFVDALTDVLPQWFRAHFGIPLAPKSNTSSP
jgi:hypothetical protein